MNVSHTQQAGNAVAMLLLLQQRCGAAMLPLRASISEALPFPSRVIANQPFLGLPRRLRWAGARAGRPGGELRGLPKPGGVRERAQGARPRCIPLRKSFFPYPAVKASVNDARSWLLCLA